MPTPEHDQAYAQPDTNIPLEQIRIYDGDTLIFDGSDSSTIAENRVVSLPGETIAGGARPRCEDCGRMPKLDVYRSAAGFYIGTYCQCGPYTRESGYYPTRELAQAGLDSGAYGR